MQYYKVKADYDNIRLYRCEAGKYKYIRFLIGGELYTEKELEKVLKNCTFLNAKNRCFDLVEISKKSIYWLFGARFENKED